MMWFEWQAMCTLIIALVLMTYANFKLKDRNAWLQSKNEGMAYQLMEKGARIKEQFKIMMELMKKRK